MHGYQHSSIQMGARTYAGVARFFSRLEMIEPGIVPIGRWCPEGVDPDAAWGYPAARRGSLDRTEE